MLNLTTEEQAVSAESTDSETAFNNPPERLDLIASIVHRRKRNRQAQVRSRTYFSPEAQDKINGADHALAPTEVEITEELQRMGTSIS